MWCGETTWKGKQFLVRKRCLRVLDRISDQNVPRMPPRNRQIIAGASYERREAGIQVSVLPNSEQEPPAEDLCPREHPGSCWICCSERSLSPLCVERVYRVEKIKIGSKEVGVLFRGHCEASFAFKLNC